MHQKFALYLIVLLFFSCDSETRISKRIKEDFNKHSELFEQIKTAACKLTVQDSIESIRKHIGVVENSDAIQYVINFSTDSKGARAISLDSESVGADSTKTIIDFLKNFDIDYLSCNKSAFVLGYFRLNSRSDIYLYHTSKIDSIYNGAPGILSISELLESKDKYEWAENLGGGWYMIVTKKNL